MARSNLAYQQETIEQSYDAQPIPLPRPRLRTIEGQAANTQSQKEASVRTIISMAVVVLVVLATVSIARVSISNSTVQMMQTGEQINNTIDQARATGLELEVRHSLDNNPTRIQDSAASLGILPANQPATVQAYNGFSADTIDQMQVAASEYRAAQLAQLQTSKKKVALLKPAAPETDTESMDAGEAADVDEGAGSDDVIEGEQAEAGDEDLQHSSDET